ncbi:MAG: ABC transporter ATP-binding protein [Candidatus Binatus sp.]|uniref:ABC transporter ATP-binding protein n=1 Tax=Candidatus Binatus sp. TaxID=2811406 RepID=UPI0027194E4D|nr:ABC transporter ATP-binding protein [Candidatus Binatus sp.]MDO8433874.1 ABC transporter ATP-binding protein [Candidatus Binatus sp.]
MPESIHPSTIPPDGAAAIASNGAPAIAPAALPDSRENLLYVDERAPLTAREAMRLLLKSWPFVARHRRLVAIKCALTFFSLTFFLMTPWPLKIVIDNVIDGHPLTGIPAAILTPIVGNDRALMLAAVALFLLAALVLIGMVGDNSGGLNTDVNSGGLDQASMTANDANTGDSLWNGLFGYLEARVTIDLTQRMNQSLRTAIYERFIRSPLALYADQKIGDAVFRVMYDTAAIGPAFYAGVLSPLASILMFAMALLVLSAQFSNQPVIVVIAILFLPVVALGAGVWGRILRSQSQAMRESGSNVMAAFEERIAQVQLIKVFGQEARETAAVDRASWASYRSTFRMIAILFALFIALMPLVGGLLAYVIYYFFMQVIAGRMTLGDVVLLLSYGMMLINPMAVLGSTWAILQLQVAGLRRVHTVLDRLGEPAAIGDAGELERRIDLLEFRGVAIGYGATTVLTDVSMSLRAGQMAALAGPSGCGKTTLIYSIPRFLEPQGGAILFDGRDSRAIAPDVLRRRVAFVFQSEALFSRSIADNIRYGNPEASDAEIREAAAMAGCAEFIEQLPERYATILGRRGARLSVGQKQRIAIARALLMRPEIMVLDEPTAPLDSSSESNLIETLRALSRDRIVLIVAHRPGTLAMCDRVFFVHDGTVAASGTHLELERANAAYRAYIARTASEIHL